MLILLLVQSLCSIFYPDPAILVCLSPLKISDPETREGTPISKFLLTRFCLATVEQKDGAHKYFEVFRMVPINQEPGATIVMGLLGCARVI